MQKSYDLRWIKQDNYHMGQERELGKSYCKMLKEYERKAIVVNGRQRDDDYYVKNDLIGKPFFLDRFTLF